MGRDRKGDLLQAAKELFGQYGYAETTFKKIADRAGVALGLLTHHYGNKEKLFLASGLDVLQNFERYLTAAVAGATSGYAGVLLFCEAYLNFSIDKDSNWLVLVRCSPYSDMKTGADRELMDRRFTRIHEILVAQLERGMADGSVRCAEAEVTAQVIISLLVGVNRTRVLTPYAPSGLYEAAMAFVARAIGAESPGHAAPPRHRRPQDKVPQE